MCFSSQNNPKTCLEHLCGIKNGARRLSSKRSKSRKFATEKKARKEKQAEFVQFFVCGFFKKRLKT